MSLAQPCRVLVVHNSYLLRGGEDEVVDSEVGLLRRYGHDVIEYRRDNAEISKVGWVRAGRDAVWSRQTFKAVASLLSRQRVDIVHVHNTFPLISPSVFWAAAAAVVPIVSTLHNFRIDCLQGMYLRDGLICELCSGRMPWPGVVHRCYRESFAATGVLASTLVIHRALGTWRRKVTRFIALNDFCRRRFVAAGLPEERIVIKPNFVEDDGAMEATRCDQDIAGRHGGIFVGRMASEKGIDVLLRALDQLGNTTLTFIGDGPASAKVRASPFACCFGRLPQKEVRRQMRAAAYMVLPSIWYENFPRTLVEAFACGLPVIASRLGALAEIIDDGRTGVLFDAGNSADLASKIAWAQSNPGALARIGAAARLEYEAKYTSERNYELLKDIYAGAIGAVT